MCYCCGTQRPEGLRGLTGQLEVQILRRPHAGDDLIILAWPLGQEGRRVLAAAAVVDSTGAPMAAARPNPRESRPGISPDPAGLAARTVPRMTACLGTMSRTLVSITR